MRRRLPHACLALLGSLPAVGVVACIPVRWTEPGSPWISGKLRGPDGRPAAGLRLAVSGDVDDACRHPAAVATTDADGRFQLPNTELVHRFFILLPFEKFWQGYRVCGGADTTALIQAYDGFMSAHAFGAPDSLSCFSWLWRSATHVTCTSTSRKTDLYGHEIRLVTTGGHWNDGTVDGSYRVISTHTGPWVVHPQLFVQWIRDSAVVSTIEITPLTTMTALVDPSLAWEGGGWILIVTGFQGSDIVRTLVFQLGPPDHIRLTEVTPAGSRD